MEKRKCSKCNKQKSEDEFNWKNKKKSIRQYRCRECTQEDSKKHYGHNETHRVKVNEARKQRIEYNRNQILGYLKEHPCVDCGETHPAALEFDHVRGIKVSNVSEMIYRTAWGNVAEEIEKCEVRCANCHNKKTAKERGYFTIF